MPRDRTEILAEARLLAREYYQVTGRPLGITGEIGEFEAERLLGLKLAPPREAGYDAVDDAGRKYQIKTRALPMTNGKVNTSQRVGSIKMSYPWDAVLLVLLDQSLEPVVIYEAQREAIAIALSAPGSKARNIRGALSLSKFKSIGNQVWPYD